MLCGSGVYWVKVRDVAQHPARHRTAPQNKAFDGPHFSSAETERHISDPDLGHHVLKASGCIALMG